MYVCGVKERKGKNLSRHYFTSARIWGGWDLLSDTHSVVVQMVSGQAPERILTIF